MKICQTHWDALRAAVDKKGMTHLIANGGEEAILRLSKMIDKSVLTIYDPLIAATMAICQAALRDGGVGIMALDENGNQYCPLCVCEKHKLGLAQNWIEGSTNDCLEYCKKNNLMNPN